MRMMVSVLVLVLVMMVLVMAMYLLQLHRPQKKRTVRENTVEQIHNGKILQL